MTAISATKARDNIYKLIQDVNVSSTPITITNNKGKNAVLIGEDDWRAIEETLYFLIMSILLYIKFLILFIIIVECSNV